MERFSILIVDDEKEFRDFYEIILTEREYEVYTANSGEECLIEIEDNKEDTENENDDFN